MGLYRKKPVVVEAVRWDGRSMTGLPKWVMTAFNASYAVAGTYPTEWVLRTRTLEGDMLAQPGDWLIRGIKGEVYPCKPDIFEQTYESAASDVATLFTEDLDEA